MNNRQEMFHTMNIMVADVLITYGFKLITFTHIVRKDGKEAKEFWFEGSSEDCTINAEKVAFYLTKGAEELREKDPEHPILWMRAALMNRGELIGIIKNTTRMVEITNGTRSALIAETASEETRRKVAAML